MASPTTSSFIYRVESDKALLGSVARMYVEAIADIPGCRAATSWREQLRYLLARFGRDVVIESLTEDLPGLSMRHAVTLADLAEREDSGRMASARI